MRRWVAPTILLGTVVGSVAMPVPSQSAATTAALAPPAPPATAATPVLSARRIAPLLTQTQAGIRLDAALNTVLADPALGPARDHTCLAVDAGGQQLFGRGLDQRLIPASNMKILTAAAALDRLGPDDRFTTEVRADRPPANGVIDGNLYLVGSGDPLIQTADYNASFKEHALPDDGYTHLEALAASIAAAGIRTVKGAVVGDESRYDTERYVPTWRPVYISDAEIGPASALTVNDGFVAFAPAKMVAAPSPAVLASFFTFLVLYLGLFGTWITYVVRTVRRGPDPHDLEIGPPGSASIADVIVAAEA